MVCPSIVRCRACADKMDARTVQKVLTSSPCGPFPEWRVTDRHYVKKEKIPMVKTDRSNRMMQPPLSRVYQNRHPSTVSVSAFRKQHWLSSAVLPSKQSFTVVGKHTVVPVRQEGTRVSVSTQNHCRHEKPRRGSRWLLHRNEATRPIAFPNLRCAKKVF